MTDTVIKPKLQLRSGASFNDKVMSPTQKLLINHGKPNFTIPRSPKVQQNNEGSPLSPVSPKPQNGVSNSSANSNNEAAFKTINGTASSNGNGNAGGAPRNNEVVVKSTKFNGVFKPANLPLHQQVATENEATKVVLRRVQATAAAFKEDEDQSVPEFIRKQRRIQERLAKDNILDFESRRSGYFTQVMISPSSPHRSSFFETMSSPAVVPALEIPPPAKKEERVLVAAVEEESQSAGVQAAPAVTNGQSNSLFEEEEVAKAIEEVNKAVAGEDDEIETDLVAAAIKTVDEAVATAARTVADTGVAIVAAVKTEEKAVAQEEAVVHAAVAVTTLESEEHAATNEGDAVTISHANGVDGPVVPSPDPSGTLGVNFEPKTVVSFSKDLGSEPNKYPDTVKTLKDEEPSSTASDELQELAKLKFDIKADDVDVQVTPVLRTD